MKIFSSTCVDLALCRLTQIISLKTLFITAAPCQTTSFVKMSHFFSCCICWQVTFHDAPTTVSFNMCVQENIISSKRVNILLYCSLRWVVQQLETYKKIMKTYPHPQKICFDPHTIFTHPYTKHKRLASFSPHHLSRRFTTNVLYKQQEN